jgi:hypothetical protein
MFPPANASSNSGGKEQKMNSAGRRCGVVDVLCVSNRFLGAVIDMAEEGLGAL